MSSTKTPDKTSGGGGSSAGSRSKLVNATIALLAAKGYESTGIAEILGASKVSRSNFYYHFKSKEELCLSALDKIANLYFNTVIAQTLGNPKLNPAERLQKHFDYLIEVMDTQSCDGGCVFTNLEAEVSDFYPSFRDRLQKIDEYSLQAIESTCRDGIDQKQFRKDIDPAVMANTVLAMFKGASILAKSQKDSKLINQTCDTLMTMLCK